MDDVLTSSKRQDFQTPESELRFVRAVAENGRINLDPFTAPNNPTRADNYAAIEDGCCGYRLKWHVFPGLIFTNPEYGSNLGRFVDKVIEEADRGAEIVTLTPSRTDTDWWQRLAARAAGGLFLKGRITFNDAATGAPCQAKVYKGKGKDKVWTGKWSPSPAPFPVFYGYFGQRGVSFRKAFWGRGRFL